METQIIKAQPLVETAVCRNLLTVLGILRGSNWWCRTGENSEGFGTCALLFSWSHWRNPHMQAKISILEEDFSDIEAILTVFILAESQMLLQDVCFQWNEGFLVLWTAHSLLCWQQNCKSKLINNSYIHRLANISGILQCQMIDWICLFLANNYPFTQLHRPDHCFFAQLMHWHKCGVLNLTVFKTTEGRTTGVGVLGRKPRSGREKKLQGATVCWY